MLKFVNVGKYYIFLNWYNFYCYYRCFFKCFFICKVLVIIVKVGVIVEFDGKKLLFIIYKLFILWVW